MCTDLYMRHPLSKNCHKHNLPQTELCLFWHLRKRRVEAAQVDPVPTHVAFHQQVLVVVAMTNST